MKIINILFCLFLLILNNCNTDNKANNQQAKSKQKRDLSSKEEPKKEKPKSPEELLREKLSEDEKKHLDWLKTALTDDGKFDKFLENDESKIKSALDHIKTQLASCNGDQANQKKSTFKTVVQGYFSGGNIDGFANGAVSNCN
ncbi:Mlp family lipoprotein [Borreliella bavariensis]|uniref:Mlp family lipoprotein n=1 Tax=Borreliella bavariensis TaxID=664662 RepID=UPI001C003642|nr:Mlp family lipoprotein [Borreliella bavariensis]